MHIQAIVKELGRIFSSVSRKFWKKRYANGDYAAHYVNKWYRKQRKNCGKKAKLLDDAVIEKMNLCWFPERILGCAKRDKQPFRISFLTIYRTIILAFYRCSWRKSYVSNGSIKNAKEQIIVEKSQIPHPFVSILPVLRIVRDIWLCCTWFGNLSCL